MKHLQYKEKRQHGSIDFPIAFYRESPSQPRYLMTYHWHTEYELIRILAGEFHMTLDGQDLIAESGDFLFLHGGMLHGGTPYDCIYECLVFDLQMLMGRTKACRKEREALFHHDIRFFTRIPDKDPELIHILNSLFNNMGSRPFGYQLITEGLIYQLIGYLLSMQLYNQADSYDKRNTRHVEQLKNALSLIENSYAQDITLDDLAKAAGMSAKYFCRFFHEMTHRTPVDYLNYYRIECACVQMIGNDMTITEAALNCGFQNLSYFIKTFKKYKGITPKQYMKMTF